MAKCSDNKNPLQLSGTNRSQRELSGLKDKFILPDERDFKDWLYYTRNIAAHVQYKNTFLQHEGNWEPFFDSDVASQLSLIAVQNVTDYKEKIRMLFDAIQSTSLQNDIPRLRKCFGLLFSALISLAQRIDYFSITLPEQAPLKLTLKNLIATRLAFSLKRLLAYYKSAKTKYTSGGNPLLEDDLEIVVADWDDVVKLEWENSIADGWQILSFAQSAAKDILENSEIGKYTVRSGISRAWIVNASGTDFLDFYESGIISDVTIYNHPAGPIADTDLWGVLNHVVNHNLFSGIFADFLSAYSRIVQDAGQQLTKAVAGQNDHEPHFALYLTFLHLFKNVQRQMNTFTTNHLDFYYKDVLRLIPKGSQPNHAYLVLELANTVKQYAVKKDIGFKAGKDSANKDVVYKNDRDVILNRAVVSELRSFYRATDADKIGNFTQKGLLYASPIAKSADGAGAKLITESGEWHPFASKTFLDGELASINMPQAVIGFALASHYLFLKEGARSITVTLTGSALTVLAGKEFTCYISTEKKWLEKGLSSLNTSASSCTFVITIDPGDAPVTAYNPKVHGDAFTGIDTPVVKFQLKNIAGKDQYSDLKDVAISSIDLKVRVGTLDKYDTTGMKELLVSSDFGTVDPSKPFFPFGQNPKTGAGLVLGSKELFSKENARFTLSLSWADLVDIRDMDYNPTDIFFPSAQMRFLEDGVWVDEPVSSILHSEHDINQKKKGELELFWGKNYDMMEEIYLPTDPVSVPLASVIDYKDDYSPYGISSKDGFMKLQLNADFQYDEYIYALQKHLIALANGNDSDPKPIPPYIPKLQSVYISYEATTKINFANVGASQAKFIHLYPFGINEVDATDVVSGKATLLPQFTQGASLHNIAEFYIGLKDVVPAQRVSVLFKVLDGSTDPRYSKPEEHVTWSYLSNNHWKDFDKDDIGDTTRQLIETGIIDFAIPEEATSANTLLPAGYHWLRASIRQMPEQVCKLIDVLAQAIQVTFFDQANAEDFLQTPLAAGTISKLVEPDPFIRKVTQPYAAFGGRYKEQGREFYTRVSERLRHKDRAITIRDFEQIVLEAFPDIHKVKCLNHTRFEPQENEAETIYNEQAPGHVTIIAIPDLRNKNAINPLRPYTNRSQLEEIKEMLYRRANCNMALHVENPAFEEVRIETTVVLQASASGNDTYYANLLKDDMVKYMTPWAYSENKDINFGGRITRSDIINFIEERDYIDFILDLKMFFKKDGAATEIPFVDEITASTARSILVSAPASKHKVTIKPKPAPPDDNGCE